MGNLKIVTGDGTVAEANKNLYEILTKLPSPNGKFELTKDQEYWYKYYGQQLVDTKKLTKPDLFHLHQLAVSIDRYIQAEKFIQEKGFIGGVIQEFKGGATNISGFMTVREKMVKEINELSKHFGFSFKDRSKLVEVKSTDPAQGDLFNDFLNAKHG